MSFTIYVKVLQKKKETKRNEIPEVEVHHFDRLYTHGKGEADVWRNPPSSSTNQMDGNGKWKAISVPYFWHQRMFHQRVYTAQHTATLSKGMKWLIIILIYCIHMFLCRFFFPSVFFLSYISADVFTMRVCYTLWSHFPWAHSPPYFFMLLLLY